MSPVLIRSVIEVKRGMSGIRDRPEVEFRICQDHLPFLHHLHFVGSPVSTFGMKVTFWDRAGDLYTIYRESGIRFL
jgi:hypothetical protein